jgi:beta-glucosidase-like glycosyl hydrolase
VQAIGAGCDVVLMCRSTADEQMAAIEDLIRAAESGRIGPARIDDALGRQRRMKERFFGGRHGFLGDEALALVGCDAHQAVAREMAAWQ